MGKVLKAALISSLALSAFTGNNQVNAQQHANKAVDTNKTVSKADSALAKIKTLPSVGDGQCYALSGYYAWLIDGKDISYSNKHTMRVIKGDVLSASNIATGWDWTGWKVIQNPQPSDYKVGQIFTVEPFVAGVWNTGEYGHTGVITGVGNGRIETVESNGRYGALVVKTYNYDINAFNYGVNSVIEPK